MKAINIIHGGVDEENKYHSEVFFRRWSPYPTRVGWFSHWCDKKLMYDFLNLAVIFGLFLKQAPRV